MWPVAFEYIRHLAATWATGWSIRLLDDAIDQEVDKVSGRRNLAQELGSGTVAYALAALTAGALLAPRIALPLFAAAYLLGMGNDRSRLPSHLPAWFEGLFLWGLAALCCGWRLALSALSAVLAVQLIDDLLDRHVDAKIRPSLASALGTPGAILFAVSAAAGTWFLSPPLLLYVAATFTYFQLSELPMRR
ncbi:MAG: hypothetical protein ACOX18_02735 [Bacillota bacterium]